MEVVATLGEFSQYADKIEALRATNPRFDKVFSEYQIFYSQLYNLQTSEGIEEVTDDFLDAVSLQLSCLEDEITDWLE